MKIKITSPSGDLDGLWTQLLSEGDEKAEPGARPDLEIRDALRYPSNYVQMLGIGKESKKTPTHFVTRLWKYAWTDQTIVGIPLMGMMNCDMGPQVQSGLAMRFVNSSPLSKLFEAETVTAFVRSMKFNGFVTLEMAGDEVVSILIGLPGYALYNVTEYMKGRISEWLANPGEMVEYWTVGLLVSRHPYPVSDELLHPERVKGIKFGDPHVHVFKPQVIRDALYTKSTRVAYVTGWDRKLHHAAERVLDLAHRIQVPEKQYRTDIVSSVRQRYGELKALV